MEWFSDPGNSAFAAFDVSVLALGVSVWAIIKSRRASRRSLQTNNKMLYIEKERDRDRQDEARCAKLIPKFEHLQQFGRYALHIINSGASEARDVAVVLKEKPISELKNIEPKNSQIPKIGSGSEVIYNWPCANNPPPPFPLEITWSHDSKRPGYNSTTLTHPTTPT